MTDLDIRFEELPPMRVAAFHAMGEAPEGPAQEKLSAWAREKGLLNLPERPRTFGYNKPDPTPGNPVYGYEFIINVGPEVESDDRVEVREFPGGKYAVTQCKGVQNIGPTWKKLVDWRKSAGIECGNHQYLEEHVGIAGESDDELTLDLFLPVT